MRRRPPRVTRTDTLLPDPTPFRSCAVVGTRELLGSGHRIPDPEAVDGLIDYVAGLHEGLSLESPLSRKVFTDGAVSWLANELVKATYSQAKDSASAAARAGVDSPAVALAQVPGEALFIVLLERNPARAGLGPGCAEREGVGGGT